ncbi:Abi family protein [Novosphingobium decolorationis]|uniref:Abi family protein n=1 Tax=Novosphingobium decolorationis TaxID=2698673 RepID=UPI001EF06160|nr:Abi family protein [Novosphingobium decolorationis]
MVKRPKVAARKIDLIGYERLRIYFLSRRQLSLPDRPFVPNTTYQHILRLYECDMRLRDACFAAVGQFEILLRNAISETLSDAFGSHPYYELGAFKDAVANLSAIQTFGKVYVSSKDQRAKHYKETYSEPALPPIWTMKEFLTFGASSVIYKSLEGSLKTKIATQFGVSSDQVFTHWLDCLVDLRNMCAHHDRLFNRSFQKQPSRLRRAGIPAAPPQKLKAILECLDYLMEQRGAKISIVLKVQRIIAKFPEMRPAEAGY